MNELRKEAVRLAVALHAATWPPKDPTTGWSEKDLVVRVSDWTDARGPRFHAQVRHNKLGSKDPVGGVHWTYVGPTREAALRGLCDLLKRAQGCENLACSSKPCRCAVG